ncbi:hypothetical protein HJC23_005933 [Cyclotella cryptica]|uniref:RNA polymerase sigma-70 domain-containing protein n=1 Tax=Cyclotella cryptica TaxID=29204 RepID=A0ABD3QZ99_9STRA|eukprot:CCRYP_000499-RA/>CCRYP_000499-RA protein AED:0.24 eAED:0.24 QI:234/1/1/1/1/1/3/2129/845
MACRPLTTACAVAVAVASFTSISFDGSHTPSIAVEALTSTRTTAFLPVYRRSWPALYARKEAEVRIGSGTSSSSSRSSSLIEEVQPLTTASEERRLNALQALTRQQLSEGKKWATAATEMEEDPLFADMDAAALLLESFTQTTAANGDSSLGGGGTKSTKRMNSVPGASSLTMLRQRAAEENGHSLSPRNSQHLYRNDGSKENRWAVGNLIEKLDEKIKSSNFDDEDGLGFLNDADSRLKTNKTKSRGRPRKRGVETEKANSTGKEVDLVTKLEPLEPMKIQAKKRLEDEEMSKSSRVTGGSLMNKRDKIKVSTATTTTTSKTAVSKGSTKLAEPLMGVSAIVKHKRRRVVKQLPKSRRDENGNLSPSAYEQNTMSSGLGSSTDAKGEDGRSYGSARGQSADSLNLNRYYRTELLTAKEEYSLGMKVKFMVKCEAVHEGLSTSLGRTPSIAEWAAACGFDEYDPEMCSENYVENDLDRQIRPSGANADAVDLDPNMFVGNGLVNDSGVGRGKGRAKKPPPKSLGKFYDDSYTKFKRKNVDRNARVEEMEEDESDIFLYRQKMYPGEPINRGSPRLFREMMLTAKEAKQRMVQCNMRLVVSIARRYHGVGVNVQDLVQEGSLGLARAAEKFDPKKGFKFSTYASWWIQQAVFRSIAYHSRTIRLPVHVHNLLNKVRRARQILQQELGRPPSNEEIAAEMDMTVDKFNKMIRSTRNAISLERPKYKNNPKDLGHESEALVGDMVDSSAVIFDEKTPEQSVDQGLFHNDIKFMLGKLGEDERTVLSLRYGINDGITRTVTLVASEMRQTKSWVRSQECRALRKLRRPWYERRLKEHRESLQASHSKLL